MVHSPHSTINSEAKECHEYFSNHRIIFHSQEVNYGCF